MSTFRVSSDFLPNSIVNQLNGTDLKVVRYLSRLFNLRKGVITLEYATVTPLEATIGRTIGRSIYAVSRSIKKIEELEIIKVLRKRKSNGTYTVNRYGLGNLFKSLWTTFKDRVKGKKNHHLHESPNNTYLSTTEDNYYGEFVKFMRKLTGKSGHNVPT